MSEGENVRFGQKDRHWDRRGLVKYVAHPGWVGKENEPEWITATEVMAEWGLSADNCLTEKEYDDLGGMMLDLIHVYPRAKR